MGYRYWLWAAAFGLIACLEPPPPHDAKAAADEPAAAPAGSPFGPGATLQGPIAKVDGEYAPNTGSPFEVKPGCHVVRSNTSDSVEGPDVKIMIQMEAVNVPVVVQAGHHYVLERKFVDDSGPSGKFTIHVREEDASGKVVRQFLPTRDQALIEQCLAASE